MPTRYLSCAHEREWSTNPVDPDHHDLAGVLDDDEYDEAFPLTEVQATHGSVGVGLDQGTARSPRGHHEGGPHLGTSRDGVLGQGRDHRLGELVQPQAVRHTSYPRSR